MDQVDVEMQDVELGAPLAQLVQHREMRREIGLERGRIEPDGLVTHRHERGWVRASALANSVTSWPSSTRASVRWATIRSVPP